MMAVQRAMTCRTWALWLPAVAACLVGCTGNRFQLANRDDTPYSRNIAANDVRVPVEPRSREEGLAGGPRVPYDRNERERFAANVPPEAQYPDGPLGAPSSIPPPLPLAQQSAEGLPPNGGLLAGPSQAFGAPVVAGGAGEIAGRVVSELGQPAPRVAVQVTDPAQPGRILAESATDEQGLFRLRNLPTGAPLQVSASTQGVGGRLAGIVTTRVPDGQVVVQLTPENALSGRSPLGNRIGGPGTVLPRTTPAIPTSLGAEGVAAGVGSLSVQTVQPMPGGLNPNPAVFASNGQPMGRVLPPASRREDLAPAVSKEANNIDWDQPAQAKGTPGPSSAGPPGSPSTPLVDPKLDVPSESELRLPGGNDLKLDDFSAAPPTKTGGANGIPTSMGGTPATPSGRPKLAFAGTGLEYARVYDLDGNKQPVGALAGDLILLDFFGSWCGPCRRAIPGINELSDRYGSSGLHVVGVACEYGQTSAALRAADEAVRQFGIRYPVVVAPMDEPSELRDHFQVSAYPTVVLVDRSGKVHFKGEGGDPQSLRQLDAAIQRVLSSSRLASR